MGWFNLRRYLRIVGSALMVLFVVWPLEMWEFSTIDFSIEIKLYSFLLASLLYKVYLEFYYSFRFCSYFWSQTEIYLICLSSIASKILTDRSLSWLGVFDCFYVSLPSSITTAWLRLDSSWSDFKLSLYYLIFDYSITTSRYKANQRSLIVGLSINLNLFYKEQVYSLFPLFINYNIFNQ